MKTLNTKYGKYNLTFVNDNYGKYYLVNDADNNDFKGELHCDESLPWKEIAELLVEEIESGNIMF